MKNEFVYLMSIANQIEYLQLTKQELEEIQKAINFKYRSLNIPAPMDLLQEMVKSLKRSLEIEQKLSKLFLQKEKESYEWSMKKASEKIARLQLECDGLVSIIEELESSKPIYKNTYKISMLHHLYSEREKEVMSLKYQIAQLEVNRKWRQKAL